MLGEKFSTRGITTVTLPIRGIAMKDIDLIIFEPPTNGHIDLLPGGDFFKCNNVALNI